jgi:chromosome partitioning protein
MFNINKLISEPKISIDEVAELLGINADCVRKRVEKKKIKLPKFGNNYYMNFSTSLEFLAIPFVKKKIAVEIVKGGTGKTTTVDNISSCINAYGARVLMIDVDPQGNLTMAKGVDADGFPILIDVLDDQVRIEDTIINLSPGLDIIPSRIDNVVIDSYIIREQIPLDRLFNNLLRNIIDNYDVIIIDLPPSLNHVVTAANLFSDTIVAPLNPDKPSIGGFRILQNAIKKLEKHFNKEVDFMYFLNKYNFNTVLSSSISELLKRDEQFGKMLKTSVRYTQEMPNLMSVSSNLFTSLKKIPIRDDFINLTREIFGITKMNSTTEKV